MPHSRRQFFTGLARSLAGRLSGVASVVADRAAAVRVDLAGGRRAMGTQQPSGVPFVRPPGAIPEPRFLETCARCSECTDCIDACPYDCIVLLRDEFPNVKDTPAIFAMISPCYLCADLPCIRACPTGALVSSERREVRLGLAQIDYGKCYQALGQPCDYCIARCPLKNEAIAFDADAEVPRIKDEHCTGCGVCAYLCPADAIAIGPARAVRPSFAEPAPSAPSHVDGALS